MITHYILNVIWTAMNIAKLCFWNTFTLIENASLEKKFRYRELNWKMDPEKKNISNFSPKLEKNLPKIIPLFFSSRIFWHSFNLPSFDEGKVRVNKIPALYLYHPKLYGFE